MKADAASSNTGRIGATGCALRSEIWCARLVLLETTVLRRTERSATTVTCMSRARSTIRWTNADETTTESRSIVLASRRSASRHAAVRNRRSLPPRSSRAVYGFRSAGRAQRRDCARGSPAVWRQGRRPGRLRHVHHDAVGAEVIRDPARLMSAALDGCGVMISNSRSRVCACSDSDAADRPGSSSGKRLSTEYAA